MLFLFNECNKSKYTRYLCSHIAVLKSSWLLRALFTLEPDPLWLNTRGSRLVELILLERLAICLVGWLRTEVWGVVKSEKMSHSSISKSSSGKSSFQLPRIWLARVVVGSTLLSNRFVHSLLFGRLLQSWSLDWSNAFPAGLGEVGKAVKVVFCESACNSFVESPRLLVIRSKSSAPGVGGGAGKERKTLLGILETALMSSISSASGMAVESDQCREILFEFSLDWTLAPDEELSPVFFAWHPIINCELLESGCLNSSEISWRFFEAVGLEQWERDEFCRDWATGLTIRSLSSLRTKGRSSSFDISSTRKQGSSPSKEAIKMENNLSDFFYSLQKIYNYLQRYKTWNPPFSAEGWQFLFSSCKN